jgi:hypothetical protein
MTRAAVLVCGADPFVTAYWLRHYLTWADQVDTLRLIVCGQDDPILREYIAGAIAAVPNAVLVDFAPVLDHGVALRRVMETTTEDVVMLCEDDAFVCRPSAVGEQFEMIERGDTDLVGCPRGTATAPLVSWANSRYGELKAPVTGEAGPLFWPCFLWAKRADLKRTDRHYGAIGWEPGATILGQTYEERQSADTFGWSSLQLREMGLRITVQPNFRADLRAMPAWQNVPWFHAGGLSTGWGMYVMGPPVHDVTHMRGTDLTDWTKRMAWWQKLAEIGDDLADLRPAYRASIAKLATDTGMDMAQVEEWRAAFQRLITWPE